MQNPSKVFVFGAIVRVDETENIEHLFFFFGKIIQLLEFRPFCEAKSVKN